MAELKLYPEDFRNFLRMDEEMGDRMKRTMPLLAMGFFLFFSQVTGLPHSVVRMGSQNFVPPAKENQFAYDYEGNKNQRKQQHYETDMTKSPWWNVVISNNFTLHQSPSAGEPGVADGVQSRQISGDETPRNSGLIKGLSILPVSEGPPCWFNDTYTNCTSRGLKQVPSYNFNQKMIFYDLHNNSISELLDFAFERYALLQNLNLRSNKIFKLSENAFSGLRNLQILDLWNNMLVMRNNTFPVEVFSPLLSLKILKINRNTKYINDSNLVYPDQALSRLMNLKVLYMDGIKDKDFGPGFQNMTSLTTLCVRGHTGGFCKVTSLRNTTFKYLTQLENLDIRDCFLQGKLIEAGTFEPLKKLVDLQLTHNEDIDIPYLDTVFYGLYNTTSLKSLSMHLIVNRYSVGVCLESRFIKYFPQYLEYFNAQENNIEGVDRHVIGKLSPSLKRLDLSGNKFVFGTYLKDLKLLSNLTHLSLNGGTFTYNLPRIYPFQMTRYGSPSHNCTLYGRYEERENQPFILMLPPKLKFIEMDNAGLTYRLSKLEVNKYNSLEYLSMVGNHFPVLEGPFLGMHSLKYLNLSSSFVSSISSEFFLNLSSLIHLNLSSNLLGDLFRDNSDINIFSTLGNLTDLDLSFNDITKLPTGIFQSLLNLRRLYLHKNPLSSFTVNISHMIYLQYLDLSSTRLPFFLPSTRRSIDNLLTRSIPIKVDLHKCPIYCDCMNIQFLTWMTTSKAFDHKFAGYLCVYADSSSKHLKDGYNSTLTKLNMQCSSHTIMFFIVGACTVLVFCIIICAIIYRFRWKIRYLYYAAYLHYREKGVHQPLEFQYDAFICYATEDEDFVLTKLSPELEKRGLSLCIHGRDFRAGEFIASNIVKAVCESRKTIVIVTRNMTQSYWCGYEIQMANMEAVHTGRKVMIFVIKEKIPDSDLGVDLLYNIQNNTYIPYEDPLPDATSIGRLWDKLASDVRNE